VIERCSLCGGAGIDLEGDDPRAECRRCWGGGYVVPSPTELVPLTLPPGRGMPQAMVPRAVARYVAELEGAIAGWRESVERNRALRIEAEARAGRLAREARR